MAEAPWRQAAGPQAIPGRTVEPPLCVQNAMLTKDKKPFTYTPGGIDLSEIRSPRMARRLEANAMNEGVGSVPQPQHPNYPTGPLPPSALAAMQPQIQVQVFPTGGIPQSHHHHGGGPPPPPPPPCGMPPPPPRAPPKSNSPLPVDAFERPDMTKIIPENPMALLRKTSGPVIKQDPIFNKNNYGGAQNNVVEPPRQPQPMRQPERQPESPQAKGLGSIYVPPVNQNTTPPTPPQRQPQSPQFANQRESSPSTARSPPAYYKRQPSLPRETDSPKLVQRQPSAATPPQRDPQSPESPKATLSKAPTPWLQKRPQQQPEQPEWLNERGRNSPVAQQPSPQVAAPWRQQPQAQTQAQPLAQPQAQSWQQRPQKQPESQPWQQRQAQPEAQPWQQPRQPQQPEPQPWQQPQTKPQSPPWQQQQQQAQSPPVQIPKAGGVKKQVNIREKPQEPGPIERTEVVIVNEPPQVFHHPGTTQRIIIRQAQPQQNNFQPPQGQGARIIPVQRDGASSNGHSPQPQGYSRPGATPTTPGNNSDARSLNRQLSWNSNPTQSNTFRVLQKITNTDGDDDEDSPVIEHSPKMPQHFPQRQGSLKNEGDQELMNKFKQVPQGQQNNNRGPKVRTIPIQIEGDGPTKTYVPPSEQTVAEPKKYMGSSIPSRSFKMLQAMTGPDDCGPGQSDY